MQADILMGTTKYIAQTPDVIHKNQPTAHTHAVQQATRSTSSYTREVTAVTCLSDNLRNFFLLTRE